MKHKTMTHTKFTKDKSYFFNKNVMKAITQTKADQEKAQIIIIITM